MYIATCCVLGCIVGGAACTYINSGTWYVLERLPNYQQVLENYPELFAPALKALCIVGPFISIFKIVDYFLLIYRDEDLSKAIGGFAGINATSSSKDNGAFSCETVICKAKGSSIPVVVPEKNVMKLL